MLQGTDLDVTDAPCRSIANVRTYLILATGAAYHFGVFCVYSRGWHADESHV